MRERSQLRRVDTDLIFANRRGRALASSGRLGSGRSMKVRDAIKLIERDGWYLVATRGSHRQFKHPEKSGRVTIAGKSSHDLAPGTLNSILKQARLKK